MTLIRATPIPTSRALPPDQAVIGYRIPNPSPHVLRHYKAACAALGLDPLEVCRRRKNRTGPDRDARDAVFSWMRTHPMRRWPSRVLHRTAYPSLPEIGSALGFSHSSVWQALERAKARYAATAHL